MRYSNLLLIIATLLTASCQEEIQLDYRDIDPLYVINGSISEDCCKVVVTHTRNISQSEKESGIEVGDVTITDTKGEIIPLDFYDGKYTSSYRGTPGGSYTLNVNIGGISLKSTSTMPGQIAIASTSMYWKEIMGGDNLYLKVRIVDVATDVNYYYYRVLRNGELFKWSVLKDSEHKKELDFEVSLMNRDKAEKNDPDDYNSILFEGDNITIEVRALDMKAYDYLFSAKLSGQNHSNPITGFDGEVLGYFSAYTSSQKSYTFQYSDINE